MRRKSRMQRGEKSDFSLEERQAKEIKQLKAQVRRLTNLLKRTNPLRVQHLESLVQEQREFDKTIKAKKQKAKDKWLCKTCSQGYMMPRIFPRLDGDYYYRMCNNEDCENRTKMKKLTEDVDLSLLERKDDGE